MPQSNSSGSVERFDLADAQNKTFSNAIPGGNTWVIDVHGDNQESINAVVTLQTSEDNSSWNNVGSAVTVVPGGVGTLTGNTGKFARITNTGALTHIIAKPMRLVQLTAGL